MAVPLAQRQIVDQPVPNVRLGAVPTAEVYGGEIGDTVARASVRMYDLQTRSSDHAAVVEAETRANEEQLRIQQDLRAFKGKEASNAPLFAQDEWSKVHNDILGSLANDRQRAMYHSIGLQKGEILNRGALQHFNQEDDRYQEETFKANLDSSLNVARANAESPVAVAFEKDLQRMRVDEHAAKHGYTGTPQHEAALTAVHSRTNREVINGLLDKGQDLRAQEFYKRILADEKAHPTALQLTAADRDVVDKALLEGSTRGASRRVASDLMARGIETADDRKARNAELDSMVDSGKIDDKTYDLAKQRLEHGYSHFDQLQNQIKDERFTKSVATIDQRWKANPNLGPREMIPTSEYAKLSVPERHTLDTYVNNLRTPGKIATDLETWVNVSSMKDADLAKLSTHDMMALSLKLDEGDRDKLLTRWNGAINAKDGKKDLKYEQLLGNDKIMNNAIENQGLIDITVSRNKLPEDQKRLLNRIENETAKALSTLEAGASYKEKKEVIDSVVKRMGEKFVVDPGMFRFNKEVPYGSLEEYPDARSIRIPMKDIPEDKQNYWKGKLREAGLPLSQENIEKLEAKERIRKQGAK